MKKLHCMKKSYWRLRSQMQSIRNMQIKRGTIKASKNVTWWLWKERFLASFYVKLTKRKIGPYKIIKKIRENAYVVDLPKHMGIDSTSNVSDLYSHTSESVKEVSSRTKLKDKLLPRRKKMMQSWKYQRFAWEKFVIKLEVKRSVFVIKDY